MTNLARKSRLAQNLESVKQKYQKEYAFFPRTFVLPRDALEFRKNFGATGKSKCTFIIKPDGGCQGRGIYLTKSLSEIDQASICVAQEYIRKPLLTNI